MRKHKMNNLNACLCAAVCLSLFSSCKDDYIYDDEAPAWLVSNFEASGLRMMPFSL